MDKDSFIWLLFFLLFVVSLPMHGSLNIKGLRTKRIINGTDAESGQFPYVINIRKPGFQICTGALISVKTVLTAAHCVAERSKEKPNPVRRYYGVLGTVKDREFGVRVRFEEFNVPEQYFNTVYKFDIGTLILKEQVELNEFVKTIALPDKGLTFVGETVISVGWGRFEEDNPYNSRLHYMKKHIANPTFCKGYFGPFNSDEHVCGELEEDGVCVSHGDSGSPLVLEGAEVDISVGIAIGVGGKCSTSVPEIYTSTSWYKDWIEENSIGNVTFVSI